MLQTIATATLLALTAPLAAEPVRSDAVLELFKRRCVECHGPSKQSGKLRLDTLDAVFRGGKGGPAIVAGKSIESGLFTRIAPDAEERMPPEGKGEPLTAEEVALVRAWIDSGAKASAKADGTPAAVALEPGALPASIRAVLALAGTADGGRLAIGRGARVEIVDLREDESKRDALITETVARLEGPRDLVQCLAFSRDGALIAAGEYRTVHVWRVEGWEPVARLEGHADRVLRVAFSPDGARLVAAGGLPTQSGELVQWDLAARELVWRAEPHSDTVLGLDWSADGSVLFTGAADRVSYILDAATGAVRSRFEGHTHYVLDVALSPDATLGVSAGADRELKLWDLADGAAQGDFQPTPGGEVTFVAFRSDREVVSVSADGRVAMWDSRNRRQRRSFGEPRGHLQAGCLFGGGARQAAASHEGTVWVYDLERNRLVTTIEAPVIPPATESAAPE